MLDFDNQVQVNMYYMTCQTVRIDLQDDAFYIQYSSVAYIVYYMN